MSKAVALSSAARGAATPRVVPFALFLSCVGIEEALRFLKDREWIALGEQDILLLYPARALLTGAALFLFRQRYAEISFRDGAERGLLLGILAGLLVFILWIQMEWTMAYAGKPAGYNPGLLGEGSLSGGLITGIRFAGAVLIVPVMEELFWRSFLLRRLIRADFREVPVGQFTWPSFLATTLLFGMEHHFFFAGIMAGTVYALLLYRTKSIFLCIIAHAVTNAALGLYVLHTGKWQFW
ncbi:MAG: CAAX prenyl protease-related protein [Alphaproteobacteria bacterium]|uniref:CAAX prenyl protease-related protein n=1 Tax=Candidatus Nitrobium versatile TaxID=2884831 RepID=A0A953LWR6_9BACT|nr:CAAX prenyl protease-related protein [Candidatus Nitrobium versatile]